MRKAARVGCVLSSIGVIMIVLLVGCGVADQAVTTEASLRTGTTASLTWRGSSDEPLPIPGTAVLVPGTPNVHAFAPGPLEAGYMGILVEPSTITNFEGLSMIAEDYTGNAHAIGIDALGNRTLYVLGTDMRVFRGRYRTPSGDHDATFCFI